jgi:hypothetical protein
MNQLFDDIINNRKFLFLQLSELKIEILNQFKFKDYSSKIEYVTDKLPKIPGIPLSKIQQNEFYREAKDLYKTNTITEKEFNSIIHNYIEDLKIQNFSLFWFYNMKFMTRKICAHFYSPFIKEEICNNKDAFFLGGTMWSDDPMPHHLAALARYKNEDEMNFKHKTTN